MPSYFEQGFSVREPAWHGLAVVLDDYPGREEAMKIAGHDFQVVTREIQTVIPPDYAYRFDKATGQRVRRNPVALPDHKAMLRSDTGEVLGVVGVGYGVVQNDVPWDIIDELSGQDEVHYETGGVANGLYWVMVRVGDEYQAVAGDTSPIQSYISAGWSHDGGSSFRFDNHDIRKVCWNTIQAANAQAEASGRTFSIRHTKHVMSRIKEIRAAILGAERSAQSFREVSAQLAAVTFDNDSVKDFLRAFIPDPPAAVQTARSENFVAKSRSQVLEYLEGPSIPEAHKRTGYGVWQAGIEYLDHGRSAHNPSTYFKRTVRPEPAKNKLAQLILDPMSN